MKRDGPFWIILFIAVSAGGFFGNPPMLPAALSDFPGMAFLSEVLFWIIAGLIIVALVGEFPLRGSSSRGIAGRHAAGSIFIIFVATFLALHVRRMSVRESADLLMRFQPLALSLHLLVIVSLGTYVLHRFRSFVRLHAPAIGIAVMVTSAAVLLLPPRTHKIFFDEDIYVQIGQSIVHDGVGGIVDCALPASNTAAVPWHGIAYSLNKEPMAYPFLVSLFVRAGMTHDAGFMCTLVMFLFGTAGMVFLARQFSLQTDSHHAADKLAAVGPLLSGLAYGLWPENLRWAVTSSTELTLASLMIWSQGIGILALRTGSSASLFLSLATGALAAMVRPEGGIYLLPTLLLAALFGGGFSREIGAKVIGAAILAGMLWHHIAFLGSVAGQDWGAEGAKFSLEFIQHNLRDNIGYWISGRVRETASPPPFISVFFIAGIVSAVVAYLRSDRTSRVSNAATWAAILLWFGLAVGIFLPFYAGSYFYGADIRFSLLAAPPFILITIRGVAAIISLPVTFLIRGNLRSGMKYASNGVAIALVAILWLPHVSEVRRLNSEAWQAREGHDACETIMKTLPRDAIVIEHIPSIWTNHGFGAIEINWALRNRHLVDTLLRSHPVFYFSGFWEASFRRRMPPDMRTAGENLLDRYNHKESARIDTKGHQAYRLYRLSPIPPLHSARH